jgi:hypothetical protein
MVQQVVQVDMQVCSGSGRLCPVQCLTVLPAVCNSLQCRSGFKRFRSSIRSMFVNAPPNFEISSPYNFQHVQHAVPDPQSATGFVVSTPITCDHESNLTANIQYATLDTAHDPATRLSPEIVRHQLSFQPSILPPVNYRSESECNTQERLLRCSKQSEDHELR